MTADREPLPPRLPTAHNAEMALVSSLLTDSRALDLIDVEIEAHHFADDRLGRVFEACSTVIRRGHRADPWTLEAYMASGDFGDLGNKRFLVELLAAPVRWQAAREYALTIVEMWKRRAAVAVADEIAARAIDDHDVTTSADDILSEGEAELATIREQAAVTAGPVSLREAMGKTVEAADLAAKSGPPLDTGLESLDAKFLTFLGSRLIVIAGRPSQGKTALATDIALHVAQNHGPVFFASLEMSHEELCGRILAGMTGIESWRMERGEVPPEDFGRLMEAAKEFAATPLFIEDKGRQTVAGVLSQARVIQKREGLALVVVDYLQLLRAARQGRDPNRTAEITEITGDLKVMAKELGVPVLALSQLSRAVENRDPPRPRMSDLRDSGSIEQDADVVMFVYRPEYYLTRSSDRDPDSPKYGDWLTAMEKARGKALILLEKQRGGPAPEEAKLNFYAERASFRAPALAEETMLIDTALDPSPD